MKQAIIYARFSPRPNADTSTSCEFQIDRCKSFCEAREFDVMAVYRDDGISGRKMTNRPGFQEALLHVCKIHGVLVGYHLTRVARNVRDALKIIDSLKSSNADLAIVTQNFDTTNPMGRFLFHVMAALAELNREETADWTRAKLKNMHENGLRTSGRPPYGWAIDDFDEKHIVEVEKEQKAIRYMVGLRDRGYTLRMIAKILDTEGYEPREKIWHPTTIRRIINKAKGRK